MKHETTLFLLHFETGANTCYPSRTAAYLGRQWRRPRVEREPEAATGRSPSSGRGCPGAEPEHRPQEAARTVERAHGVLLDVAQPEAQAPDERHDDREHRVHRQGVRVHPRRKDGQRSLDMRDVFICTRYATDVHPNDASQARADSVVRSRGSCGVLDGRRREQPLPASRLRAAA